MEIIHIGIIIRDIRTTIPVIITLMAILTTGGTREVRIPTGILSTDIILIRKLTLIGSPMSDGADRRGGPLSFPALESGSRLAP